MQTTGDFHVLQVDVPMKKAGQKFTLIPFGDVHRDAPGFADDVWQEFLARAKSAENPLFLGMGDYTDSVSTSERIILGDAGLHESTKATLAKHCDGTIALLSRELSFMRGKMIGILGGNHYYGFEDGTTGDQRLASKLGCPYLGVCAAIRVSFSWPHSNKKVAVDIWAHHGQGAGTTVGGSLNRVAKMAEYAYCNIFLMGHDHGRGVVPLRPMLTMVTGQGKARVKEYHQIGRAHV